MSVLEECVSQHTEMPGYGKTWIQDWLLNIRSKTIVPPHSPVTLIEGIRILFEYPYGAILYRLGCVMKVRFEQIIAVGDVQDTQAIVIHNSRIVKIFKHRPEQFRFTTKTELEDWMVRTAAEIRTAFRSKA